MAERQKCEEWMWLVKTVSHRADMTSSTITGDNTALHRSAGQPQALALANIIERENVAMHGTHHSICTPHNPAYVFTHMHQYTHTHTIPYGHTHHTHDQSIQNPHTSQTVLSCAMCPSACRQSLFLLNDSIFYFCLNKENVLPHVCMWMWH